MAPGCSYGDEQREKCGNLYLFQIDEGRCAATGFVFVESPDFAQILESVGVRQAGDTVFAPIRPLLTVSPPLAALERVAPALAARSASSKISSSGLIGYLRMFAEEFFDCAQ